MPQYSEWLSLAIHSFTSSIRPMKIKQHFPLAISSACNFFFLWPEETKCAITTQKPLQSDQYYSTSSAKTATAMNPRNLAGSPSTFPNFRTVPTSFLVADILFLKRLSSKTKCTKLWCPYAHQDPCQGWL